MIEQNEHEGNHGEFELLNRFAEIPKRALIIGTYARTPLKETSQEHCKELDLLIQSYGGEVVGELIAPLNKPNASLFIGRGKVEEIRDHAREIGAQVIIFDDELTPSQQRNLEEMIQLPVADRSEVILGVFAVHARTREAKLQIELAEIQYQMPRLKRLWTHLSKQRGGGVNQKGEGESQIELDKRMLNRRLEHLKREINEVVHHRKIQHRAREKSEIPTLAIVGYTNAGKSTLMNALTEAEVLVEDKLFATLDTTTRKYTLPNEQEVLLIDTVGFIRKLPHLLVAAFRSTLEESVGADILIILADGSHPRVDEQIEATEKVLEELNVGEKEHLIVFNKIDQMDENEVQRLRLKYQGALFISATEKRDLHLMLDEVVKRLAKLRAELNLRIPQSDFNVMNRIYEWGQVLETEYEGNDLLVKAQVPKDKASIFSTYLITE